MNNFHLKKKIKANDFKTCEKCFLWFYLDINSLHLNRNLQNTDLIEATHWYSGVSLVIGADKGGGEFVTQSVHVLTVSLLTDLNIQHHQISLHGEWVIIKLLKGTSHWSLFFLILQLNFEVPHKTLNHKQIIIYETAQAG